jgi:hypothetical protein
MEGDCPVEEIRKPGRAHRPPKLHAVGRRRSCSITGEIARGNPTRVVLETRFETRARGYQQRDRSEVKLMLLWILVLLLLLFAIGGGIVVSKFLFFLLIVAIVLALVGAFNRSTV